MGTPEVWAAFIIVLAMVIYTLTGGVDLGAGSWVLFPPKERSQEFRDSIFKTLGPVWEANHTWLIAIIVLLFEIYPLRQSALASIF